ncbi:2'-5' RNA ligase superfamily protein [Granulicella rosea]|uniref:2'-5' RNA ligase superfamily protein n=1 Tax=Granulicella rosea TaxID=474952 RepID=A0A239J443_9BACT|nr:2'-5' RNA ligase family protein [Granulicella rosea]SNS99414.1 2'-5' RNA ligase superfamily protein [Granulicella rosea]
MSQPLLLTLQIDELAQSFYENLRVRYFPRERNHIPAHLSLFHQLPDEEFTYDAIRELAYATPAFRLTQCIPRSIGHGVAVFLESESLTVLHATLSKVFQASLIAQDRQPFRPHIVVQNKVEAEIARHTLSQLQVASLIEPKGVGLSLWRYLGGPWEHLVDYPFNSGQPR